MQRRSSVEQSGGSPIRARLALASVAILVGITGAGLYGSGLAQTAAKAGKTEARYAGGFRPDACRYPKPARDKQLSGCCQMDLEVGPDGRVISADGVCSDPLFLEPTVRCLAAQEFIPATRNGQPVRDLQHLEYEWRATTPSKTNLCNKLKTS